MLLFRSIQHRKFRVNLSFPCLPTDRHKFGCVGVEWKIFGGVLAQNYGGPFAKFDGLLRVDSIADRQDNVQTIKDHWLVRICDPHFLQVTFLVDFTILKNALQMSRDNRLISFIQIHNVGLRCPKRVGIKIPSDFIVFIASKF